MTELEDYLRFEKETSVCNNNVNHNTAASMTSKILELEAQNKALWELVGHVDALLAADERGQGIGYAEAIQRCAKTLAAIQNVKEAKV